MLFTACLEPASFSISPAGGGCYPPVGTRLAQSSNPHRCADYTAGMFSRVCFLFLISFMHQEPSQTAGCLPPSLPSWPIAGRIRFFVAHGLSFGVGKPIFFPIFLRVFSGKHYWCNFIRALLGAFFRHPFRFFANIKKMAVRSAAVFGIPVHTCFPHVL